MTNVHFTDWTQDETGAGPARPSFWQRLRAALDAHRQNARAIEVMRVEWRAVMAARRRVPPHLQRDRGWPLF